MHSRASRALLWVLTSGAGCSSARPDPAAEVPAAEAVAEARSVPVVAEVDRGYVGVVIAGESVDIAPKTAGELVAVHVRTGDRVEGGDRIATLDDRRAHEELKMTTASLRSAQARLQQTKIDAKEARRKLIELQALVRAGHDSRSSLLEAEYEEARANATVVEAQAEVATLRTTREQRERELVETTLVAPFSGTIAERYADAGTVVAAGSRVVRLISGDTPWVRFAVPPADVKRLQVGDVVVAELETLHTTMHATIRQVAPEVDGASHLVFVEAQLELPPDVQGGAQTGAAAWVRPLVEVAPPP